MAAEERIDPLGGQHTLFVDGSDRPPGGRWWWYGIWPLSGHWRLSADGGGRTVVALGGQQRLASQWTATVSADIGGFWRTVVIGLLAEGGGWTTLGRSQDSRYLSGR